MKMLVSASVGSGWIKLHPEVLENISTLQQAKPGLSPKAMNNQNNVRKQSEDNPNWSGACDDLSKLGIPTLVITGTDDNRYQPQGRSQLLVMLEVLRAILYTNKLYYFITLK